MGTGGAGTSPGLREAQRARPGVRVSTSAQESRGPKQTGCYLLFLFLPGGLFLLPPLLFLSLGEQREPREANLPGASGARR